MPHDTNQQNEIRQKEQGEPATSSRSEHDLDQDKLNSRSHLAMTKKKKKQTKQQQIAAAGMLSYPQFYCGWATSGNEIWEEDKLE